MSIRLMTWVWANSPYSGERLLLHLALADFANDDGVCFPSHGTLAKKARCSQGWVAQTIKQMLRDSLIEIVEPAGQGRGKVGRYRLLLGHTECDLSPALGHTLSTVRSHSDTSDSSLLNRQESKTLSADFDRLWSAYPRKTSKGTARKVFDRVMRQADAPTIDALLTAVTAYGVPFVSGAVEMKFCAYLSTWLNGERWHDETSTQRTVISAADVPSDVRPAEQIAVYHARSGRSESDLLDSVSHYSHAAQQAAVTVYRDLKAGNT